MAKHFAGHGRFEGAVVEHDAERGYRVAYDDGDEEHVGQPELLRLLLPPEKSGKRKAKPKARAKRARTEEGA